jgi:hypothetical protein
VSDGAGRTALLLEQKGNEQDMMKTMTSKPMRAWRTMAVGAAMVTAGLLLALVGTAREAEATFPGNNGKIAFASNRTTGEGVNNPEGDFEIFTMNRDGTNQK